MKYRTLEAGNIEEADNIEWCGRILHRIRSLKDFSNMSTCFCEIFVSIGSKGGYIEKESNLSQEGNCWIENNAIVCDNASVEDNATLYENTIACNNSAICDNAVLHGNAIVKDNSKVYDNAEIFDNAIISGNSIICDNTKIYDNAVICGDTVVCGNASIGKNAYITSIDNYISIGPIGFRHGYTTFYLDKDKHIWVSCGYFHFNDTIEKFKEEVIGVHRDDKYGKEYLKIIAYALIYFEKGENKLKL